jgi:hypothetical protein
MNDLLDQVIEAHGGLKNSRGVRSIDVLFNFSGGLLDLKGFPGRRRPVASVDTSEPRTVLQRLDGDPDDRWIFTPDRVWIERRDGEVVQERSSPRDAFKGHERTTPWDRLHRRAAYLSSCRELGDRVLPRERFSPLAKPTSMPLSMPVPCPDGAADQACLDDHACN